MRMCHADALCPTSDNAEADGEVAFVIAMHVLCPLHSAPPCGLFGPFEFRAFDIVLGFAFGAPRFNYR